MRRRYHDDAKEWILDEYFSGELITTISERYSIHPNTIRKWIYEIAQNPNDDFGKRIKRRIDRNNQLKNEILNRIGKAPQKRFELISQFEESYSVSKMTNWLGVSESGYYKWKKLKTNKE